MFLSSCCCCSLTCCVALTAFQIFPTFAHWHPSFVLFPAIVQRLPGGAPALGHGLGHGHGVEVKVAALSADNKSISSFSHLRRLKHWRPLALFCKLHVQLCPSVLQLSADDRGPSPSWAAMGFLLICACFSSYIRFLLLFFFFSILL